jgi:PAS domain S-box-containing protein
MDFLGYSEIEFATLKLWDVTHPDEIQRDRETARRLVSGETEKVIRDKRYIRKDGIAVWGHVSISLMKNKKGRPRYYLELIEDITEKKIAEEALQESLGRFRTVSEMTTEWASAIEIKPGGKHRNVWRFGAFEKMTGYNSEELEDMGGLSGLLYDGDREIYSNAVQTVKKGESITVEVRIVTKRNEILWMQLFLKPIIENKPGEITRYISAGRDITARKKAEEDIMISLREKEALLRELYHRTKNNMQVISALLQLYSSKNEDERVRAVFHEMVDRIQSMALVHQKLYQSKNLSSIDLSDYIMDLSKLLLSSYSEVPEKISLVINAEKIPVQIDVAVPCGLILNELISNSLKHAFPGGRKGEILITLRKTGDDIVELCVADNGIGVPDGFDFRKSEKMGIQSVYAIIEHQLRGDVLFESNNGVRCTIHFKREYGIGMD